MADFADNVTFTDAATAISQGKRHLLVRDYTAAVAAFGEGLELLARKHGDGANELGEPYLLYGRALLGLARSESGVLGNGVLGSEENDEDEEDELSEVDEKDEEGKENNESAEQSSEKASNSDANCDEKKSNGPESLTSDAEKNGSAKPEQNGSVEEDKNGEKSSNSNNSEEASTEAKENDDEAKENEDDDEQSKGIDLQVAWEVLELARNIFFKRGASENKHLAEAYRLLGEVAMESGNNEVAVSDLKKSLDILQKAEPIESRALAELHYQLGLAHLLLNEFDTSIEQFNEAIKLLEKRIHELETSKDVPASDDPFYSVEGEIKELKELLPDIQEKIVDTQDLKKEAYKAVIEDIKSKSGAGSSSNSTATSSAGAGTSGSAEAKPASNISHLVRKKRRTQDTEEQNSIPVKKTP